MEKSLTTYHTGRYITIQWEKSFIKKIIPRYNFMFFMYLKWLWLLHFFALMLYKQFKFKMIEINK